MLLELLPLAGMVLFISGAVLVFRMVASDG